MPFRFSYFEASILPPGLDRDTCPVNYCIVQFRSASDDFSVEGKNFKSI